MKVRSVYQDGCVFDAAVLDINDAVITAKFMAGVANVAAFSREIGIPTEAALPHMMVNAFKNLVSVGAEIEFEQGEGKYGETVAILKDPGAMEALKAAAASSGGGGASGGG